MAINKYNPTSNARRGMTSQDTSIITAKKPLKSLTKNSNRSIGRNNQGRITVRHKGSGSKRLYRNISFNLPENYEGKVEHIEYDPFRTARIARVKSRAGSYNYIIAPQGIKQNQTIKNGSEVPIENGNRMPLKSIPLGSIIHAIELIPGGGAKLVRGAGSSAQLISKDDNNAQVRLPSSEVRIIRLECYASIGSVSNEQHQNISLGKAGRNRHKGVRPTVRGVVMNAVDHPHGGGDGGRHRMAKAPRTPWGQKTLGYKTRRNKSSDKYIARSRHEGKRR